MLKKKKVLFFSSVKDVQLFKVTGFYVEDIQVLKDGGFEVITTNKISDFLKFWTYDVAFLYFYKISLIPAFLARFALKKVIFTGGIDEFGEMEITVKKRNIFKALFKLNYMLSNVCNVVSKNDLENVSHILGEFPKQGVNKLSYFPHSIDTDIYNTSAIFNKEDFITSICWMATVANVKRKGLDTSVELFSEIKKKYPNFKLVLIGAWGDGKSYIEKLVEERNLKNDVIFTGSISEKKKIEILANSKYYFQLSTYEGFGIAVLEAMALKNYIFHTGKGGLKDTVENRGCIIEPNVGPSVAVQLFDNLEKDYDINNPLLESNRQHILTRFSRKSRSDYFKEIISNFYV
ncbi:glycosyltransferase involved in cell wall biosynthesis [Mucilaginibacter yixingensis]|uniref:Glycosyltransferase involved in cell wall biosynthesis n=1 Tax=Mucilaginibacter yixingensis TaxID=1295612 RepID=A0A2T5JGN8_9SPHI|nr:glycosyltransferase [Mucilaginibacter yixingensis]PTR01587.1 glycosyltransferase involved in cell wall biosynthesis [Mucilaginibacter yixingensis]